MDKGSSQHPQKPSNSPGFWAQQQRGEGQATPGAVLPSPFPCLQDHSPEEPGGPSISFLLVTNILQTHLQHA